jgi:hypothetical protein
MLIFKQGKWIEISLPEYVDPSWGVNERTQLAHLLDQLAPLQLLVQVTV